VQSVHLTNCSFWARGNGQGSFNHTVRFEFKNAANSAAATFLVQIPNTTAWAKHSWNPMPYISAADSTNIKAINLTILASENSSRTSYFYVDQFAFDTDEPPSNPPEWSDDQFLDLVGHRAFSYFSRFTDKRGFVQDRSTFSDLVSVGGIGFQLAAYCIGHKRGWEDGLEGRVLTILTNALALPMGPAPGTSTAGNRGFFYHFLDASTGLRKDTKTEVSVYDTMLLEYGALAAKAYFPSNAQIQTVVRQLCDRVEWTWMVDSTLGANSNRLHLAWVPEPAPTGTFTANYLDSYTDEALLTYIMALGSTNCTVPLQVFNAQSRVIGAYPGGAGAVVPSWTGSAFTYFFADCWLNLKQLGVDLHQALPVSIWKNNQRALAANRQFCMDHADSVMADGDDHYTTYGSNSWGITACDNLIHPSYGRLSEYYSFGALPTEQNVRSGAGAPHVGTLAVYGAGGAINFLPTEAIAALRNYFSVAGLWHPLFGFGDAYSLDPHYHEVDGNGEPILDGQGNLIVRPAPYLNGPWVNNMVMAIDAGPILLAIENHRSGMVWALLSSNQEVRAGSEALFGRPVAVTHITVASRNAALSWQAVSGGNGYAIFGTEDLAEDWHRLADSWPGLAWTNTSIPERRFYSVKAKMR
jgi:hypothetical protein